MNEIKPVFQNLSDVTMLEKCLHGWNDSKLMSHSANSYGIAVRKTYLLQKNRQNGCEFCNYKLQRWVSFHKSCF